MVSGIKSGLQGLKDKAALVNGIFITCDGNHSSVLLGQDRCLVEKQCRRERQWGGPRETSGGPAPESSDFSAVLKTSPCHE